MPPILFLSLSRRESRIASRLLSLPSLVLSPAKEERGEKASLCKVVVGLLVVECCPMWQMA
jgi:hypothetical protein